MEDRITADDLKNFLDDLISELQQEYTLSLTKEQSSKDSEADIAFKRGRNIAYYEVLDLIQCQLIAFGFQGRFERRIVPELENPAKRNGA